MARRTTIIASAAAGAIAALAVWGVLALAGAIDVGGDDDPAPVSAGGSPVAARGSAPSAPTQAGSVRSVYEGARDGVVLVEGRGTDAQLPFGPPREDDGVATGTGFVVDTEGHIVTNQHVVDDAEQVRVRFGEKGERVEARVLGSDASSDLAVLKVDPSDAPRLKPLPLGASEDVHVGDTAIAIGNPFGLERTLTAGVVSATDRRIDAPDGFSIDDAVQTDAPINSGNSGGPLLDGAGRVIGVNAQIRANGSGGNVGIGFAVPVDTVKEVLPQLKEGQRVRRAYLGVSTASVDAETARQLDLPRGGALIQQVTDGSPADRAELRGGTAGDGGLSRGGDLIVAVDGKPVRSSEDVSAAIEDKKPGDRVRVEIYRGDEKRTITVTLGERPKEAR
jgi:S1-C subfamily serine protease